MPRKKISRPTLLLVSGPPGAGKSTLSKAIAKKLKMVHLDKDCIDEPFSPNDRGVFYTQKIEPKVLEALLNLAELNLKNGLGVILDVPWTHILIHEKKWIKRILKFKKISKIKVLEAKISEFELRKRIQKRNLKRDQVKLTQKGWKKFLIQDCVGENPPLVHRQFNFHQGSQILLKEALPWIKSKNIK